MDNTIEGLQKRIDERIPYSGNIFFSGNRGFFEGELKNYSKNGLFIKTKERLSVGEFITVALPFVKDEEIKFRGQILWRNSEGYGIELIRKRSHTNFQADKIEAKSK